MLARLEKHRYLTYIIGNMAAVTDGSHSLMVRTYKCALVRPSLGFFVYKNTLMNYLKSDEKSLVMNEVLYGFLDKIVIPSLTVLSQYEYPL